MTAHPEGGYFRRHFESEIDVRREGEDKALKALTSTYFLTTRAEFSALHKLKSDEVWHHYEGASLLIHILYEPTDEHPSGVHKVIKLGNNLKDPEATYMAIAPRGTWFGSEIDPTDDTYGYSHFGLNVAPGFTYEEFELGNREALLEMFPEHKAIVTRLTRE